MNWSLSHGVHFAHRKSKDWWLWTWKNKNVSWHHVNNHSTQFLSSSSSRSHLVVGSLRQTQFSSSQFCHGPHLSSFRWLSCLGWHSPSISASVFRAFFSRVIPSPESFFPRSLGLASLRGQTTWVALSQFLSVYWQCKINETWHYKHKT